MDKHPALHKVFPKTTIRPLPAEELRWRADPDRLDFEDTREVDPYAFSFCQPRAEKVLAHGLSMEHGGHIFVCGQPGTARRQLIEEALSRYARAHTGLFDYLAGCPSNEPPRLAWLRLPAGEGRNFVALLSKTIQTCQEAIREVMARDFSSGPSHAGAASEPRYLSVAKGRMEEALQNAALKIRDPMALEYFKALERTIVRGTFKAMAARSASWGAHGRERANRIKILERIERFSDFEPELIREADLSRVPVVYEHHPTLDSLLGYGILYGEEGSTSPNGTIRFQPGSLMRAQGGYLVVDFEDMVRETGVWKQIRRCLAEKRIRLPFLRGAHGETASFQTPEPIPLEVKLLTWGDESLYQEFYQKDPHFRSLFSLRADLDCLMERNEENVRHYVAFVKKRCEEDGLPPFHRTGVSALLEEGAELAGKKERLTTLWGDLAEIIRESAYWARQEESPFVRDRHVRRCLEERRFRRNLPEEQLQKTIQEGLILIKTDGAAVGEINGIALYETEDHLFGKPCRITVQTGLGRSGVINIEREANLSGKIHDKGVLILCGYLRDRYARNKPLNLSASLCMEQFYSEIDGDSASLAEICALLSSLAGVPLSQGIAVTGSISQQGEVQAVGCVNEKISGFFEVCLERGLTGDQGVILPVDNVQDLMLPETLVNAAREGKFLVYAVRTVEEALKILTGLEAGTRDAADQYPAGTLHRLVDDRLWELARGLQDFFSDVDDDPEGGEEPP